ncbi:interferon kappa [Apodemus sylvaticus]|uniref:interferon kappa n=1 Tax=Apodemus sylvaticus TaxID=10129 RepID=UPI00224399A7|nr:interferon kappa [Apodemus sylvaticus]
MTPKYLWLVALVALCTPAIQSLNCVYLDHTILENVKLLGSTLTGFPLRCLKDITDFQFSKEILPYLQHMKKDINAISYRISALALTIFNPKGATSQVKEEHLERIRSGLFDQLRQARECFVEEERENREEASPSQHPHSGDFLTVYLELSNYFFRIKMFLKNKKYSFCAWKIVAAEIRRCFIVFYKFKRLLKMKSESPTFKQELK